ncbi:DEKNAAC102423 [Brettanomyces naardenensis]|uniref:DEKNAAC102423 n=1 Tax=Brettanomyces naardenensis TaxID=13370 RepID=A0A448YKR2_BRENA|nr:DEKNAAC102423 [Brettanomyces naardenensis]
MPKIRRRSPNNNTPAIVRSSEDELPAEQNEQAEENAPTLDGEEREVPTELATFSLPDYYPLTRHSKSKLRSLTPWQSTKSRETLKQKYLDYLAKAMSGYVDVVLEKYVEKLANNEITKEDFEEARRQLYKDGSEIKQLRSVMNTVKETDNEATKFAFTFNSMKAEALERTEPELTIENMALYQNASPEDKKHPYDLLMEKLKSDAVDQRRDSKADQRYRDFERQLFVTINPTEPLPFSENDKDDDDDIEVEGGKISLECPISHDLIEDPVKSTKCGHTYDKTAVLHYLRNSAECPVCPTDLKRQYLVEDTLMKQRLLCYSRDAKLFKDRNIRLDEAADKL